ncbi:glycoside hydrolase family 3 protein [Paenibacillus wynnii]|uniref:glycoside hydrolase family 3 protein n=1 Tax=Paenibacillus wynnii TaxID=268407 RepID=UPI00278E689A|nr:glycoside hydrolase family 3 N-terminal domain-containing protein [Paenibacillus wynnii]MDQ0194212.1 beta-N-acetylhexosaminidase [Paenibacillus wynnii]
MLKALSDEERHWVERTLKGLSLKEKIGQTMQDHAGRLPFKEMNEETIGSYLEQYPVGSFFIGGEIILKAAGKAGDYRKWIETFQKASKHPLLFSGDLEFGAGSAVGSLTAFPPLLALAAADDESLAYEYGKYTALEGRAAGFTWALAPGMDILLNWMNPVITTRCLGDDPRRVGRLSAAVIRGMQDYGLAACAKHFPGDGVDYRDQHITTTVNDLSEEEWFATYGQVTQQVIKQGVMSIMTGHIALPWMEGGKPGRAPVPATVSSKITHDLLRGRFGFEGIVLSDALDMGGFLGWGDYRKRTLDCFSAGTDVLLWPGSRYFQVMEQAIEEGAVSMERLDQSVRRILEMKARLGVQHLDNMGTDTLAVKLHGDRLPPEQTEAAQKISKEAARRCVTLIRNRAEVLPLQADAVAKVLVIMLNKVTEGRQFKRMGRFVELLAARGIEVDILDQFEPLDTIWKWEQAGKRWDVAFLPYFMPLHGMMNTARPVGDAAKAIWAMQQAETIRPIGVSFSTPYLLQDIPFLDTLVHAYSLHEETMEFTIKAMFGEIPFEGKSPVRTEGLK